jgi:hypothetical protein
VKPELTARNRLFERATVSEVPVTADAAPVVVHAAGAVLRERKLVDGSADVPPAGRQGGSTGAYTGRVLELYQRSLRSSIIRAGRPRRQGRVRERVVCG